MRTLIKVFLGLVGLAIMVLSAAPTQGRRYATPEATTPVTVAESMGQPPTDCGQLAEPIPFPGLGPSSYIGTWPIAIGIPNVEGQKAVLYMPDAHLQTDDRLPGWWSTKMAWFVNKDYHGVVRAGASNIQDGSPMYIVWHDDEPETVAEFDATKSYAFIENVKDWAFFPSNVWVSKAGCYRFSAEWEGGLWQQVVAVGHISLP